MGKFFWEMTRMVAFAFVMFAISARILYSQEYWIPFRENDLWGVKDGTGREIYTPAFDSIFVDHPLYQFYDDLIVVTKNGKSGILNIKGVTVIAVDYDAIFINPGMDYDFNSLDIIKTSTGLKSCQYNRVSKYTSATNKNLPGQSLYFIVLKREDEYSVLDRMLVHLIPHTIDDLLVNADIISEYGIMIAEHQGKSGIIFLDAEKFSGFKFASVSYWPQDEYLDDEKPLKIMIDGFIASAYPDGRTARMDAVLILPEQESSIHGRQHTRSWIYDFTVYDSILFITDAESYLYCFTPDSKCLWTKHIPDLFSHPPIVLSRWLIAGNMVIDLLNIDQKAVTLAGRNIKSCCLLGDCLYYIADFGDPDVPAQSEIPGWADIFEQSGFSSSRLICFNLNNMSVTWNRSLPEFQQADLTVHPNRNLLYLSFSVLHYDPENLIFILQTENGEEVGRYDFMHPQQIRIVNGMVITSDICDPDIDLFCQEKKIRAFKEYDLESSEWEIDLEKSVGILIQNDNLYCLENKERIDIFDSRKGKKLRSLMISPVEEYLRDNESGITFICFHSGQLYLNAGNSCLFSIDAGTGDIAQYGFYSDNQWIDIRDRSPVISGNHAYLMDDKGNVNIFKLK